MKQPPSIFNDVIGPVLTGPSSSHTAGPCRIGLIGRQLCGNVSPQFIMVRFDRSGSFASSYNLQGTDRGLVGGLLGMPPDDLRLHFALDEARKQHLEVSFLVDDFEADHPNTAKIKLLTDRGETINYTGKSTGGGMFQVTEINEFPVDIVGDCYELLIICEPSSASKIKAALPPEGILNINQAGMGGKLLINAKYTHRVNTDAFNAALEQDTHGWFRQIDPVLPILSPANCSIPFRTNAEMMEWLDGRGCQCWEAAVYYEARRGGISEKDVFREMGRIAAIMEKSVYDGFNKAKDGQIIKARAAHYRQQIGKSHMIPAGAMDTAIAWTMAVVEVNSRYGVVVAAPTAGACGVLPGAILGTAEHLGLSGEEKTKALLTAGLIGLFIAEQATFSSELCGCQAECGAASSMAAAGLVQLAGGSPEQCAGAASMAMQNVLGMICDSVADLVEVPCLGKNVLGTVNAIACANMALAGVKEIIPLDEAIQSMYSVGQMIPSELCCTGRGGLAITETSKRIKKELGH